MFHKKIYVVSEFKNSYSLSKPLSGILTLRSGSRLTNVTLSLSGLPLNPSLVFFVSISNGNNTSMHKLNGNITIFTLPALNDDAPLDCVILASDSSQAQAIAYAGDRKSVCTETARIALKRFNEKKGKTDPYFKQISDKLNYILKEYPPYTPLIKAVKNSYWVKIKKQKSFYALGIVIENDAPRFICYALPETDIAPDSSFSYLETEVNNVPIGFFVLYQDAFSGNLVTP